MTDDQLTEAVGLFDVGTLTGLCELVLENTTPAGWDVVIVSAGANFYYRDGSSDTDGPRAIQLRGGEKTSFFSRKPSGCTNRIFLAITVVARGEPGSKTYTANIDDVKPDECMRIRGLSFGPKNNISESLLKKCDWADGFIITAC
ncbi:hypothetical protein [Pseudomonas sp. GM79]|uniref:hypothetical protein n=1 Tax=Pseudomonas sp. GM79 TaxID=1144338 RepID=UPI0012FCC344|nr:hypothetical protein [Pseudomonas sp. GM79]